MANREEIAPNGDAIAAPDGPHRAALDRWCGGEPDPRTIALLRQAEREVR